jgi:hypothetical protein
VDNKVHPAERYKPIQKKFTRNYDTTMYYVQQKPYLNMEWLSCFYYCSTILFDSDIIHIVTIFLWKYEKIDPKLILKVWVLLYL